MATDRSDESLVEAALAGDHAAYGELAARYRGAAFGIALSKLGDFEAARDAAQDALVRAYVELPTLRDRSKFAHWLHSIAVTAALTSLRRRRNELSLDAPIAPEISGAAPDPEDLVVRSERAIRVSDALMKLPEQERLPLILHYVDGYSHQEIGEILGATIPALKNRIYRARRRMREEMLVEIERSLKDERSAVVKDVCIIIQWWGTPCHCRCSHCLLDSGRRLSTVPFERARSVADRFVRWRDESGSDSLSVDLITGYACDSDAAAQAQQFSKTAGATAWWFLSANGIAMRGEAELRAYLESAKKRGITSVGVTFYGLQDYHDRWAGRAGDWEFVMLIARTAAELGLHRQETVFISRDNAADIPALVEILDAVPGERSRSICPWDYRGRGKKLEEERVLAAQVDALPDELRHYINQGHVRYRSESEWIRAIEDGEYPRKDRRVYLLSVWEDNIDYLESTECSQILHDLRGEDERLYQAIPSLPTLARLYGQKSGKRMYWVRDLEWKWIDLYLQKHQDIQPIGRFNDLDSMILWR